MFNCTEFASLRYLPRTSIVFLGMGVMSRLAARPLAPRMLRGASRRWAGKATIIQHVDPCEETVVRAYEVNGISLSGIFFLSGKRWCASRGFFGVLHLITRPACA